MTLPGPDGMSLEEWAAAVVAVARLYGIGGLGDGNWQLWGEQFFLSPQLGSLHPTNPYQFEDWRDWGRSLVNSLLTARGAPGPGA